MHVNVRRDASRGFRQGCVGLNLVGAKRILALLLALACPVWIGTCDPPPYMLYQVRRLLRFELAPCFVRHCFSAVAVCPACGGQLSERRCMC